MKNLRILFSTFLPLFFVMPTSITIQMAQPPSMTFQTTQPWTWLFYDDADSINMYDPLNDLTSIASSSQNLTILVLQDTQTGPGKIWLINQDHTIKLLEDLGEINMGDPATMKNFINFGKENYPAERYLLCIYDHGSAWLGSCVEENPVNDLLTMHELYQALVDGGGIDLLCFTAPCLMGPLEVIYELKDNVDAIIGDEELSGYNNWNNVMDDISSLLTTQSSLSTYEVAKCIIQFLRDNNPDDQDISMSAVRTDGLGTLCQALNILCKDFFKRWFSSFESITLAHEQTIFFGGEYAESYHVYDFYHFTQNLYSYSSNTRLRQDIQTVQEAFSKIIISTYSGRENAHGVSIYFPNHLTNGQIKIYGKAPYGLDFSSDSLWNEFLSLYALMSIVFNK